MNARPLSHWLLLFTIVALWGSAFGITELAIEAFTPIALVTGRMILASILLTLMVVLRGQTLPRSARFWAFSLAMAIAGNCLPFWLISAAQQQIDSGLAGILMSVMPLTTLLLAHVFVPGESLSGGKLAGFMLGFVGIVVLIGPEALLELRGEGTAFWWEVAALLAAFCYAANAIIARHRPPADPIAAAAGTMIVGAVIMVPIGFWGLPEQIMNASASGLLAGLALAVLASSVAPVVFLRLITLAGPSFVAFINYLIPLWAVFVGILLLGEEPRWTALAALALILAGLALSEIAGQRAASGPNVARSEGDD
ncbi:MAG: DMT family transporter [Alphaproteobacteria bacterium]